MGWRGVLFACLAALSAASAADAAPKPQRIVSTHLCGDQLLLLLAPRERIAALSYFAADPHLSQLAEEAAGLPRTRGLAEEILPLDPDLVFAGAFSARPTVFLLRRLGRRVVELPAATDFSGVSANIRLVADAIGEPEAGDALIRRFEADLAKLPTPTATGEPPVAALYWSKGYTPASASLAAEAARRAGFVDLGAALGLAGAARTPLETLLRADPELLVKASRGPAALADLPLRHPSLRKVFAGARSYAMPDRLWICGAPFVAEAVRRLQALRP